MIETTEVSQRGAPDSPQAWPARSLICSALGAATGLAADALLFESTGPGWDETQDVLRISTAGFLIVAGILFAITVERARWLWSAGFAVAGGIVVAAILHWNGSPSGWQAGEGWHLVAAFLAIVLAAPLFQSARDSGAARFDPAAFHHHAWANVILWFAAWGFVLIAFLLAHLLAALFALVGIEILQTLLRESWFVATLIAASFGGAVGLLRERDRLLATIQRAALAILAVLAPVLALGLALFILALPFTGLAPLWEQTKSTTPILLTCVIGAIVFANAVIGEEAENRRPLRIAAMVLAAVMLPLALVAAISTGLRIDQHGLTPDRLWGLTFVVALTVIAVAYAAALPRRKEFAPRINFANIRLAIGLSVAALFLATPLASFGALSTRDQLARLADRRVKPIDFDWSALRFDFGPAGRAALERLVRDNDRYVAAYAKDALAMKNESERYRPKEAFAVGDLPILVRPVSVQLPPNLGKAVFGVRQAADDNTTGTGVCRNQPDEPCVVFWRPGETTAIAVQTGCRPPHVIIKSDIEMPSPSCGAESAVFEQRGSRWVDLTDALISSPRTPEQQRAQALAQKEAVAKGEVEVRTVSRRQLFIGGDPASGVFE